VGRLAPEVTSFVNRRTEVAEVKRLLAPARLVTLVGAAGTGKSRLATRVASELRRAFIDGAWQVDLAGLGDESLLEYTVAEALGLGDAIDLPAVGPLIDHLADRKLLLILDNCEHLVDACAELIGILLPAAGGLRVLCTTRQPLGMVGETQYTVTP
jgi:predicted ATPase